MAKRPKLFSVKRFAPVGIRGKIFRVCQEILNTGNAPAGERIRNATMVGIVGPVVQFTDKLPPYPKIHQAVELGSQETAPCAPRCQDKNTAKLSKNKDPPAETSESPLYNPRICWYTLRIGNTVVRLR